MYVESDDIRQTFVISKNEIRKFIRGKRFLIYVILAAMVFSLITFLPYAFDEPWESTTFFLLAHNSFIYLMIILGVTLFASTTYVSEFEDRTALIVFTRPVKKTSIYLGKFIGCFIMEAIVMVGYFAAMATATLFFDSVPSISQYLTSLGCVMLFLFASSALAAIFSVTMKKSGTAAILTFFTMFLFISIITAVIARATGDTPWYMLDYASSAVFAVIPDVADMLGLTDFDMTKAVATMMGWGIVSMIISWFLFTRKEM